MPLRAFFILILIDVAYTQAFGLNSSILNQTLINEPKIPNQFLGNLTELIYKYDQISKEKLQLCGKPYNTIDEMFIGRISNLSSRVKRIILGNEAKPHSHPWIVSLQMKQTSNHFCSGFLINENYVVTAAHCLLRKTIFNFKIVFGLHRLDQSNKQHADSIAYPYRLIFHENFNIKNKTNDIALIRLEKPVKFSNQISSLCLPDDKSSLNLNENDIFYVAGWGRTSLHSNRSNANRLKQAVLKVMNNSVCAKYHLYDPLSSCCAMNQIDNSNICFGDSGVPLIIKQNDRWYAYGIASYALKNSKKPLSCDNRAPSYFTRLTFYSKWIENKISSARKKLSEISITENF